MDAVNQLSDEDFDHLGEMAQTAIRQATQRLDRAQADGDVEAIVGSSKELAETVAKAILERLGVAYPSSPDLPKLGKMLLESLKMHPSGLQKREALRNLAAAFINALSALAALRNTDGTGHGRAEVSDLDLPQALFAREISESYCRWALGRSRVVVRGLAAIEETIQLIEGGRAFRRGELPEFLADRDLEHLGAESQHRIGRAVGRRWNVGGTFNVRDDVIEPIASGQETYPPEFSAGVIEGLIIDHLGYVRTKPEEADRIVRIGSRLPSQLAQKVFWDLAELIEQADSSYAFSATEQRDSADRFSLSADSMEPGPIESAIRRIARRIAGFVTTVEEDH